MHCSLCSFLWFVLQLIQADNILCYTAVSVINALTPYASLAPRVKSCFNDNFLPNFLFFLFSLADIYFFIFCSSWDFAASAWDDDTHIMRWGRLVTTGSDRRGGAMSWFADAVCLVKKKCYGIALGNHFLKCWKEELIQVVWRGSK